MFCYRAPFFSYSQDEQQLSEDQVEEEHGERSANYKRLRRILPEDLVKFGMLPELVGRMPVVVPFHDLDVADLVHVLSSTKNALVPQYEKFFQMDTVHLEVR